MPARHGRTQRVREAAAREASQVATDLLARRPSRTTPPPGASGGEDLELSLRRQVSRLQRQFAEAQREQFATLTLSTAVELTAAALKQMQPTGGVDEQAVADMGGTIAGKKVEVLVADHQNKADVAAAKAREWFDTQGLDMLIGGTNSGTSLAMSKVALEKKKLFISVGAATSALTNEQCSPYTVHYAYDTTALGNGTLKSSLNL